MTLVDAWLWCAYMMRVEEDEIMYAYPRPDGWEELSEECARGAEAFRDAADRANGKPTTAEDWQRAMALFENRTEEERT